MSKPVFEGWFEASGRRNRKSYFLYEFPFGLLPGFFVITFLREFAVDGLTIGEAFAVPLFLVLTVSNTLVTAQRCRDLGWSGWYVLLFLIPLVGFIFGLILLLQRGDIGENKYGEDPLQTA